MAAPPATGILDHFQGLVDPRVERTKRHGLLDIVAIALCAVIGGADAWVDVDVFGRAKRGWLSTFLALPHGIPSHDTFGRVFAALDPEQFEAGFRSWVQAVARLTAGEVVAVDGKVLRRSHDRPNGKEALALVSACASQNRLVLKGCIVTIDAIGCQTAIAQQIVQQEADYVLALKDNQGTLHQAVKVLFAEGRRLR